jgi:hypothetical protein
VPPNRAVDVESSNGNFVQALKFVRLRLPRISQSHSKICGHTPHGLFKNRKINVENVGRILFTLFFEMWL